MKTTKDLIENAMRDFKYNDEGEITKLGACNIMMGFMADYIGYDSFRFLLAANTLYFENTELVEENITDLDRIVSRIQSDDEEAINFCLEAFTSVLEDVGDDSPIEFNRMLEAAKRETQYK